VTKKINILIIILFAVSVVHCSSKDNPIKDSKINIAKVLEYIEVLKPSDASASVENSKVAKISDSYGGIDKKVAIAITKDVYVTTGCLGCTFDLTVSAPVAIITSGGSNIYNITKTQPFEGDVYFVTHGGQNNKYNGAKMVTYDEFRKFAGK